MSLIAKDHAEDKKQKFIDSLRGTNAKSARVRIVVRPLVTRKFDSKKVAKTIEQLEHICK